MRTLAAFSACAIAAAMLASSLALAQSEAASPAGECIGGLYAADELRAHLAIELAAHAGGHEASRRAAADVRLEVRAEDCSLEEGRVDVEVEIASRGFRRSTSTIVSGPDVRARSRMLALFVAELVRSGLAESSEPPRGERAAAQAPEPEPAPARHTTWSIGIACAATVFAGYGAGTLGGRVLVDWAPVRGVPLVLGLEAGGAGGVALDVLGPLTLGFVEAGVSVGAGALDAGLVAAWASMGGAALSGTTPAGEHRSFGGPIVGVGARGALLLTLAAHVALMLEARVGWYVVGLEVTSEGRAIGGVGGPSLALVVGASLLP